MQKILPFAALCNMMADCHHCDLEHILKFYMRPTLGNYFEVGEGYGIFF